MNRKLVPGLVGAVLLIAGAIWGLWSLNREGPLSREEAVRLLSPELREGPITLPPERNAIGLVRQALRISGDSHDWEDAFAPLIGGRRAHEPDWAALTREFKKRETVVEIVRQIVEKGAISFDSAAMYRESLRLFDISVVLRAGFRLAFRDGRFDKALQLAMLSVRLARAAYAGKQSKLVFLTAHLSETMGLAMLRALVNSEGITGKVLERILVELPEEGIVDNMYMRIQVGDFHSGMLKALLGPEKSKREMEMAGSLNQRETLRLADKIGTAQVRNTRVPWSKVVDIDALKARLTSAQPDRPYFMNYNPEFYKRTAENIAEVARFKATCRTIPNSLGLQMIQAMMGGAGDELAVRRRAQINCLRCLAAVRLFQGRMHRLPKRLEELVDAGILSSVPVDPFMGDSILWNPKTTTVFSVGKNMRDDGGQVGASEPASRYEALDIGEMLRITGERKRLIL